MGTTVEAIVWFGSRESDEGSWHPSVLDDGRCVLEAHVDLIESMGLRVVTFSVDRDEGDLYGICLQENMRALSNRVGPSSTSLPLWHRMDQEEWEAMLSKARWVGSKAQSAHFALWLL